MSALIALFFDMVQCSCIISRHHIRDPGSDSDVRRFETENLFDASGLYADHIERFSAQSVSKPFYDDIIVLSIVCSVLTFHKYSPINFRVPTFVGMTSFRRKPVSVITKNI
jgi:hypothetical protein